MSIVDQGAGSGGYAWCLLSTRYCGLLCVLLVLFLVPASSLAAGRVTVVFDGDTFRLAGGEVVRLAGIDAPELGREGRADGYFAREAKARLEALVRGHVVRVEPVGEGRDRYGRTLGLVRVEDGRVVNELMVREGYALVYAHEDTGGERLGLLLSAQREAMDEGRGFWPRVLGLAAAQGPVVGNSRSRRFFPLDCPESRRIGKGGRVRFASMARAFWEGYSPARDCGVWPVR